KTGHCSQGNPSDATRVGLRGFTLIPERTSLEWLDGPGVIKMDHHVELLAEACVEILTAAFGKGTVDHANRPLETWNAQSIVHLRLRRIEPEALSSAVVKDPLMAVGQGRPYALAFGVAAPVVGRG